jgi:hypothetical protein
MPLEEKLTEKVPFDVYAMMLIVSFVVTGAACLLANYDLRQNWFGAEEPPKEHAVYLTVVNGQNDQQATTNASAWVQITEQDIKDFKVLQPNETLKPAEYPAWLDPLNPSFSTDLDKDNTEKVPEPERQKMKEGYAEKDPTTGVAEEEKK